MRIVVRSNVIFTKKTVKYGRMPEVLYDVINMSCDNKKLFLINHEIINGEINEYINNSKVGEQKEVLYVDDVYI